MVSKKGRFITFILKEKSRDFFAFAFFVLFLLLFSDFKVPLILEIIGYVLWALLLLVGIIIYINDLVKKLTQTNKNQRKEKRIKSFKLIIKELMLFIPIWVITLAISSLYQLKSAKLASVEEFFKTDPIYYSILLILIGPIVEEFIFRLLPYRFIKEKTLYIVISSIIFAGLHVISDPNPFYNIWPYMIHPLYYASRYYLTKDLRVPICLHSFNNLTVALPLILSCF